jgi:RNA polymerase sigma factor (sigma-70 family)
VNTDLNEVALVQAAQRGDKAALIVLLVRYRPLLLGACRRVLGPDLAEDAAQEAAVHALLGITYLRRADRFGPWLVGIGLNVCRNWLRKSLREAWAWSALYGGRYAGDAVDSGPSLEDLAEAADVAARVRNAISALPPGQRAVVVAYYLSGMTYREMASSLGIGVGAVRTRLHKGRTALRKHLVDLWEEELVDDTQFVEMEVVDVRKRRAEEEPSQHVVILQELEGRRTLPIWIGAFEAASLALQLERVELPRPGPYDFLKSSLEAIGGRLVEVRIERLADQTFYATAALEGRTGTRDIDARPSDALNLALHLSSPIRVNVAVLEAAQAEDCSRTLENEGGTTGAAEIATEARELWTTRYKDPRAQH